jgi:tetratricopeptide (TPR) repeat protein
LRSAEAALKDQTVVTESRYLLGLTLAMKAAASDGPPALDSTRPESLAPDWQVEDALDWITPAPAARAKPAEHVSFDRPNAANDPDVRVSAGPPDHAVATVSVQGEKLAQLLQRLAKAAELELHWSSDAARQIASEHTVTVATEDMSFTVLLAGLTDRWGLVWSLAEGNTLKIEAAEALSAAALGDHRLQTAHNVLQYALLEAPDDRWQRRGLLALGNVVLCQGDLDQAAVHYQRVCDNTASPFNVVASYNWGLVQWLKGDWEDARRSWFVVADGAPGHPLAPLALCQIGRTYLDAGELPEAAATFARVLSGRPDREVEARAVLYQALAHLLKREPHESQTVLKKHKGSFEQPRHHRAAEFLISFAHYQTLADERQRTDEAVHMARSLVALHHDDEDLRWLGAAGAVVIGRACGELHLGEKRVDVYRKALEEKLPRGAIEREMRYTLAEHEYDSADSRTAALDKWTALAQESDRWAMLARLKLAGHDLALGRREACLLGCRKVLQEWRDPAASQQALDLMGCVYEQQGNYKQAALCYARDVTAALNGPASQP